MEAFRGYLQQEYIQRSGRNGSYSLRSFARQLKINHATLSGLLSGKRKITATTIKKIGPNLGMGPEEIGKLLTGTKKPATSFVLLEQDTFNAISDWYFDAILEFSKIPNVNMQPEWIAKAIGISVIQAKAALETLKRLGLLKEKKGKLSASHPDSTNILDPDLTSAAQKKYQRAILQKSLEALDNIDRKNRDHSSTTIAIDKKDMRATKALIQQFRSELNQFLQRKPQTFNEVYQLQISFFPLSDLENK